MRLASRAAAWGLVIGGLAGAMVGCGPSGGGDDTTPPAPPVITSPINGSYTNDSTPTISGTAEKNSTVEIFDGMEPLGTTTANAAGSWTFTPTADLEDGAHTLTAKATDAAGNTSAASDAVVVWIDTQPPEAPTITNPANGLVTHNNMLTISGSAEANTTVRVFDGTTLLGTAENGPGYWTFTPTRALSEGAHTLTAKATDAAGNTSAASNAVTVTIDTVPPNAMAAPTDDGDYTADTTVKFRWTAGTDNPGGTGVARYEIVVWRETATGNVDIATASVPAPGLEYEVTDSTGAQAGDVYKAKVRAYDFAGNAGDFSPASDGIVYNPDVPGKVAKPSSIPAGPYTNQTVIRYIWSAPSSTYPIIKYNVHVWGPGVTEGTYDSSVELWDCSGANGQTIYVAVRAVSAAGAGEWSDPTDPVTIDTQPPNAPGTPQDEGTVSDAMVTFTWTAASDNAGGSGIEGYTLGLNVNGTPLAPITGITETTYTFDASSYHGATITAVVCAYDRAGNIGSWSEVSDGILVDAQRPQVWWTNPGNGSTNVSLAQDIVIQFSEPMDQNSVAAALSLSPAPDRLVLKWDASGTIVTVVPDNGPAGLDNLDLLEEHTAYTLSIAQTATDLAGNQLASGVQVSFETREMTPPELLSVEVGDPSTDVLLSPAPADDVEAGDGIFLTFSEPMSRSAHVEIEGPGVEMEAEVRAVPIALAVRDSLGQTSYTTAWDHGFQDGEFVSVTGVSPESFNTSGYITVVSSNRFMLPNSGDAGESQPWTGTAAVYRSWGASLMWSSDTTLIMTTDYDLKPGKAYKVEMWDLNDLHGNWTSVEFVIQVESDPSADSTPPTVVSTIPANGATGVDPACPILISFSEQVAKNTLAGISITGTNGVSTDDFTMLEPGEGPESSGTTAVFIPNAALPAGTQVTVTVPTTIADLAGNTMAAQYIFSYTVGTAADTGGPTIGQTVPADGDTGAEPWRDIVIWFVDAVTGRPEELDPATIGMDDILVVDDTNGVVLRGWNARYDGQGRLRLSSWPYGAQGLQAGHAYTVTVGPNIADIYGNAMAAAEQFSFTCAGSEDNHTPSIEDLQVRICGSTGPSGRTLQIRMRVRDADDDPVTVTIEDARDDSFLNISGVVSGTAWGAEWSHGGDGPPTTPEPGMNDDNYPVSGWYEFVITLDDGTATASYSAWAWVWRPDEVPTLVSVGGVDVSSTELIAIDDPTPTFVWENVDSANADYLAFIVADVSVLQGNGPEGAAYFVQLMLPPDTTSFTLPDDLALPAGIYLWTVLQYKAPPGFRGDPLGQGWALDILSIMEGDMSAFFAYSPDREDLDFVYTVGQAGVSFDNYGGGFLGTSGFEGTYGFDGDTAVTRNVTYNDGNWDSTVEAYAYDDPELVVTLGGPLSPGRGYMGRGGDLFVQAQATDAGEPYMLVGAPKLAGTFNSSSLNGIWSFVQMTIRTVDGTFDEASAAIGYAACYNGTVAVYVRETSDGGGPQDPFATTYTVSEDGLVSLAYDMGLAATGYIGGNGEPQFVVLVGTNDSDNTWYLVMVKNYDVQSTDTVAGDYRFVTMSIQQHQGTSGPVFDWAMSVWGTASFDGDGGWSATMTGAGGMSGTASGTYELDDENNEMTLTDAEDGVTVMRFGPDLNTAVGLTVDPDGEQVQIIVATK